MNESARDCGPHGLWPLQRLCRRRIMVESYPIPKNPRFQDLTGKKFGSLIVLAYAGSKFRNQLWHVECGMCGRRFVHRGATIKVHPKCVCMWYGRHGRRHSSEYQIWASMLKRCLNPAAKSYVDYGGRGITVCPRWRTSFQNFVDDMGPRPSKAYSIDRIDNNGPYSPENCRWTTRTEQNRNSRHCVYATLNGKTQCLKQWCRELGISYHEVRRLIYKAYSPASAIECVASRAFLRARGDRPSLSRLPQN